MLQNIFFNAVEVSFFMCPEWVIELFTQLISWKTQMIHEQNKSNLFYYIKICRSANPIPKVCLNISKYFPHKWQNKTDIYFFIHFVNCCYWLLYKNNNSLNKLSKTKYIQYIHIKYYINISMDYIQYIFIWPLIWLYIILNISLSFYFLVKKKKGAKWLCPPIDTKVKEPRISMEMELLLLSLSGLSFFCILFWVTVYFSLYLMVGGSLNSFMFCDFFFFLSPVLFVLLFILLSIGL